MLKLQNTFSNITSIISCKKKKSFFDMVSITEMSENQDEKKCP